MYVFIEKKMAYLSFFLLSKILRGKVKFYFFKSKQSLKIIKIQKIQKFKKIKNQIYDILIYFY